MSRPVFICQECGQCCYGFGGTYVSDEDIQKIAKYVQTDSKTFVEKYCVLSGSRWVLRQRSDGYCMFEKGKRCDIHPVKPKMCREWPHIKSVLVDIQNWQIMAGFCLGMQKDATEKEIRAEVIFEMKKRNEKIPEDIQ